MKKTVTYTKRYYKTTTKEVEIPAEIANDSVAIDKWLHDNSLELFEDEITSASLNLEYDEIEWDGMESEDDQKEVIIERINDIIEKHGEFSVADVEADYSPFIEGSSSLSHLMEDFTTDGGTVYVYDPQARGNAEEIDRYDASYEDLSLSQLEYVLKLAEKWVEYNE